MNSLFALLAVLALTLPAHAFEVQSSTGASLGQVSKLRCGNNVNCTKVGNRVDVRVGDFNQVTASTTALTAAQCGSTVISAGAVVQPLPEASTVLGCQYTFVCGTADDFDIDPADATDAFGVINSVAAGTGAAITPSAGDEIRCTDAGSSITLQATAANTWSAIGVANGAWTDVN